MDPEIYPIVAANGACTALLGTNPTRFWPFAEADESPAYPYATYGVIAGAPENMMDKVPTMDRLGTQISVWGKTAASCNAVALAIRNALEPHGHMISIGAARRDPKTRNYGQIMEFDFLTDR